MLPMESFATKLLQTEDLDPVYSAIHRVHLSWGTLGKLLLSYWCFYNLGAAAFMAEHPDKKFWELMHKAARNEEPPPVGACARWPRASERRHFRGAQAIAAVTALEQRCIALRPGAKAPSTEGLFNWIVGAGRRRQSFTEIRDRVLSLRGFGPWIAFKVTDMTERLTPIQVDFSDCAFGVYKDPRQGAALARFGDRLHPITDQEVADTMSEWCWKLRKFKAPPSADRKVGVQEVETVFCKYKSYTRGHYEPGKDTIENIHNLEGWGGLAQDLRRPLLVLHSEHWRKS